VDERRIRILNNTVRDIFGMPEASGTVQTVKASVAAGAGCRRFLRLRVMK